MEPPRRQDRQEYKIFCILGGSIRMRAIKTPRRPSSRRGRNFGTMAGTANYRFPSVELVRFALAVRGGLFFASVTFALPFLLAAALAGAVFRADLAGTTCWRSIAMETGGWPGSMTRSMPKIAPSSSAGTSDCAEPASERSRFSADTAWPINSAKGEKHFGRLVQPRPDAIEHRRAMLAHHGPIRTGAFHLDFARLRKQSVVAARQPGHHAFVEATGQQVQHRVDG